MNGVCNDCLIKWINKENTRNECEICKKPYNLTPEFIQLLRTKNAEKREISIVKIYSESFREIRNVRYNETTHGPFTDYDNETTRLIAYNTEYCINKKHVITFCLFLLSYIIPFGASTPYEDTLSATHNDTSSWFNCITLWASIVCYKYFIAIITMVFDVLRIYIHTGELNIINLYPNDFIIVGLISITQIIGIIKTYYIKNIFIINLYTYIIGIYSIISFMSICISIGLCVICIQNLYKNLCKNKSYIYNYFIQPRFLINDPNYNNTHN